MTRDCGRPASAGSRSPPIRLERLVSLAGLRLQRADVVVGSRQAGFEIRDVRDGCRPAASGSRPTAGRPTSLRRLSPYSRAATRSAGKPTEQSTAPSEPGPASGKPSSSFVRLFKPGEGHRPYCPSRRAGGGRVQALGHFAAGNGHRRRARRQGPVEQPGLSGGPRVPRSCRRSCR